MPHSLTSKQIEQFRRDGVLCPLHAFSRDEVDAWLQRLEAIEARMAGRLPPAMNAKPHLLLPWLWEIVQSPHVVGPVKSLLGPDVLCWATSFISKGVGDRRYVAWHQDATYWDLSSPQAVTAWIALTPSTPESGCVRVIPGSHRQQLPHRITRNPANILGRREEILVEVDERQAVDLVLEPGQLSLHDVLIIHGSSPNLSPVRRTGFAVRYIPSHVRQLSSRQNSATLVCGRDFGNFALEQKPEGDFHADAVARHAKIVRQAMEVIFAEEKTKN